MKYYIAIKDNFYEKYDTEQISEISNCVYTKIKSM